MHQNILYVVRAKKDQDSVLRRAADVGSESPRECMFYSSGRLLAVVKLRETGGVHD